MKKTKTPQTPQLQEPDTQSKRRLSLPKVAYSAFLCVMMSMIFCQPAYAATDVWTKAKEIMQDVYTQILAISTIAAIVTASVALLLMNFSRSGRTVDESRAWLKRICVLEVTLPGLLPKRKQRQNTEFLLDPFYFSLEQYAKEHPMPHFSDCVVCFTQVYDQCLPTRRIRDYDNLEEKQLLDVLSTFVMADDTGLLCDAYNTAALGEKDCTRISVMEKKRFPAWLAEHENTLKSISDF